MGIDERKRKTFFFLPFLSVPLVSFHSVCALCRFFFLLSSFYHLKHKNEVKISTTATTAIFSFFFRFFLFFLLYDFGRNWMSSEESHPQPTAIVLSHFANFFFVSDAQCFLSLSLFIFLPGSGRIFWCMTLCTCCNREKKKIVVSIFVLCKYYGCRTHFMYNVQAFLEESTLSSMRNSFPTHFWAKAYPVPSRIYEVRTLWEIKITIMIMFHIFFISFGLVFGDFAFGP